MENVVGETIPENLLIRAAKRNNYDFKAALDSVLNSHTSANNFGDQQMTEAFGKGLKIDIIL